MGHDDPPNTTLAGFIAFCVGCAILIAVTVTSDGRYRWLGVAAILACVGGMAWRTFRPRRA
jgi:hypothetical protein